MRVHHSVFFVEHKDILLRKQEALSLLAQKKLKILMN